MENCQKTSSYSKIWLCKCLCLNLTGRLSEARASCGGSLTLAMAEEGRQGDEARQLVQDGGLVQPCFITLSNTVKKDRSISQLDRHI